MVQTTACSHYNSISSWDNTIDGGRAVVYFLFVKFGKTCKQTFLIMPLFYLCSFILCGISNFFTLCLIIFKGIWEISIEQKMEFCSYEFVLLSRLQLMFYHCSVTYMSICCLSFKLSVKVPLYGHDVTLCMHFSFTSVVFLITNHCAQ